MEKILRRVLGDVVDVPQQTSMTSVYCRFASSSVYYGISYNLRNLPGDKYINVFISGIVEIPALIYVIAVNNK